MTRAFTIPCPGLVGDEEPCGFYLTVYHEGDLADFMGCWHTDDTRFNLTRATQEIEQVARDRAEDSDAARYYHQSGGL